MEEPRARTIRMARRRCQGVFHTVVTRGGLLWRDASAPSSPVNPPRCPGTYRSRRPRVVLHSSPELSAVVERRPRAAGSRLQRRRQSNTPGSPDYLPRVSLHRLRADAVELAGIESETARAGLGSRCGRRDGVELVACRFERCARVHRIRPRHRRLSPEPVSPYLF